jgi:PAS domain S-box-containing protein
MLGRPNVNPLGNAGTATLDAAGNFLDADDAALEILGRARADVVGHNATEFMVQPPSAPERAALEAEWERAGSPDVEGATSIRRPDGSIVRVRFLITPRQGGGSIALMEPLHQNSSTGTTIRTVGYVLAQWRAAERRLDVLDPSSEEAHVILAEVAVLRTRYHQLVEERRAGG